MKKVALGLIVAFGFCGFSSAFAADSDEVITPSVVSLKSMKDVMIPDTVRTAYTNDEVLPETLSYLDDEELLNFLTEDELEEDVA